MGKYTEYVGFLEAEDQWDIITQLVLAGIEDEDFERALDSRVCDLEETIDVSAYRR